MVGRDAHANGSASLIRSMRLTVAAVGRVRDGPIADLIRDYTRRLPWELQVREVAETRDKTKRKSVRSRSPARRRARPGHSGRAR